MTQSMIFINIVVCKLYLRKYLPKNIIGVTDAGDDDDDDVVILVEIWRLKVSHAYFRFLESLHFIPKNILFVLPPRSQAYRTLCFIAGEKENKNQINKKIFPGTVKKCVNTHCRSRAFVMECKQTRAKSALSWSSSFYLATAARGLWWLPMSRSEMISSKQHIAFVFFFWSYQCWPVELPTLWPPFMREQHILLNLLYWLTNDLVSSTTKLQQYQ